MMPIFLKGPVVCMDGSILSQGRVFSRVEKIFEVAFGAGDAAGGDAEDFEFGEGGGDADFFYGFGVEGLVGDYAAFGDVGFWQFELGFYEDEEIGVWFCCGGGGGQDFCGGDEGDVDYSEVDGLGDVGGVEFAGVAFDFDDAGVLLELPG